MKLPFQLIKNKFGNTKLVGAEIGIFCADNASEYIKGLEFKRMYMIDPYPSRENMMGYTECATDNNYSYVANKFMDYDFVRLLRMTSKEASLIIGNETLDWVYIDGNHLYPYASEDMRIWYPKVKVGGFFGGHDWVAHASVKQAVLDVSKELKLDLNTDEEASGEWWTWKN